MYTGTCVTYGLCRPEGLRYVLEQFSRPDAFTPRPNAPWGDAVVEPVFLCSNIGIRG